MSAGTDQKSNEAAPPLPASAKASKVWRVDDAGNMFAETRGGGLAIWSPWHRGGFTLVCWKGNTPDMRTVGRPLPSLACLVVHPLEDQAP